MAGKGITIGVAADTREFTSGVAKGVIKPLDGIVEALEDVAKEGDDAGAKLEQSLKDTQDETERLKKDYKTLGDAISDSSKTSSRDFTRNTKTATTGAKKDLEELGREAKANFAETLSSFDGTVQGTISGIQGTLGGVTAGLSSVAGIAAAAAGAAGLGLIATAFEKAQEEAKQLAEDTNTAFEKMLEAGNQYYTAEQENEIIRQAITDEEKWKKATELSKLYGISIGEAVRAVALEGPERDKLIKKIETENTALATSTDLGKARINELERGNLANLKYLDNASKAQDNAIYKTEAYYQATEDVVTSYKNQDDAIQKRNERLDKTPSTVKTKLVIDDSELEKALKKERTIKLVVGRLRNGTSFV